MSTPSREHVIKAAVKAAMANAYVCLPGRIEKVDHAKQLCDVQPMIKRRLTDATGEVKFERLPVIKNVPLLFPRAGGFFSYLPPAVGNSVVLHFVDFSTDEWLERGAETEPKFSHSHELTDCFATPGGYAKPSALSGLSSGDAMLGRTSGNTVEPMVVLKSSGEVHVGGDNPGEFVALATQVLNRLNAIKSAFDGHVHPFTGTVAGAACSGTTTPPTSPMPAPTSVAASKVKAL